MRRRSRAALRFGSKAALTRLARLACWAWLAGTLSATSSAAYAQQVQVQLSGESCPDAALLEQKLAPLLPDRTLVVGSDAADAPSGSALAAVRDQGQRYVIEVAGLSREVEDPARDCTERARVAAVFIALNLGGATQGAAVEQPKPEAAKPAAEEDDDAEEDDAGEDAADPPEPAGLRVGVRLLGDGAYAPALDRGTLGGAAGAWLAVGSLRFALTLGALAPARVSFPAQPGAVSLLRIPIVASAEYALRFGSFFAGPALGLVLDVLRMRGLEVERAQTELRVGPGVMLAVDVGARLSQAWLLRLRAHGTAFARAYDLRVEPLGSLERTPRLWLGASLGLDWQF